MSNEQQNNRWIKTFALKFLKSNAKLLSKANNVCSLQQAPFTARYKCVSFSSHFFHTSTFGAEQVVLCFENNVWDRKKKKKIKRLVVIIRLPREFMYMNENKTLPFYSMQFKPFQYLFQIADFQCKIHDGINCHIGWIYI